MLHTPTLEQAKARRRMTRAARKHEALEGRLRVLLGGASSLYTAVARAVSTKHEQTARAEERRLALWRAGAIGVGPSRGVLAVWGRT